MPFVWSGVSSATWSLLITALFGLQWTDGWDLQLLIPAHCNYYLKTPEDWQDGSFTHCPKTSEHIKTIQQTKYIKKRVIKVLYICDCKLNVLKDDFWCRAEEEWQPRSTSQESAEFDTQTKSSPLLLKGLHWRVKQQTESQCDCLSNEKITALHLTEMTWSRRAESIKCSSYKWATDMLEPAETLEQQMSNRQSRSYKATNYPQNASK